MEPKDYDISKKRLILAKVGYYVFYDSKHPLRYKTNGMVYLHRHLASVKIGRWVNSDDHIHHVDSNRLNNELDNLEVLTQREHAYLHNKPRECNNCRWQFKPSESHHGKFCSDKCKATIMIVNEDFRSTKIKWPSIEEVQKLILENPMREVAKILGLSDNGVKKFAKKHNLFVPPRGYWTKKYYEKRTL